MIADASHSNMVNLVGGSPSNSIAAGVHGSVIAGGGGYHAGQYYNTIAADFSFLGGGYFNSIQTNASGASFLGGGYYNSIKSNASYTFLGGGVENVIQSESAAVTLTGGSQNEVQNNANYAVIAGGRRNIIGTNGVAATIGGGSGNAATGNFATVPGGTGNEAGSYSFAAGRRAKATHAGALVWADSTNADFASTSSNQFLIRASGGVGIGTNAPGHTLDVNGPIHTTAGIVFPDGSVQAHAASTFPLRSSGYTNGTTVAIALNGSACSFAEPLRIEAWMPDGDNRSWPTLAYARVKRVRPTESAWASAYGNVLNGGIHASSNWFALTITVTQGASNQTITVSNLVPYTYELIGGNGQLFEVLRLTGYENLPLPVSRSGSTAASSPSADVPGLVVQINGASQSGIVVSEFDLHPFPLSAWYDNTNRLVDLSLSLYTTPPVSCVLRANVSAGAALFNWFAAGDQRQLSATRAGSTLFTAHDAFPRRYQIVIADDGLPIEELFVGFFQLTFH